MEQQDVHTPVRSSIGRPASEVQGEGTPGKINADVRCQRPTKCAAKTGVVCRSCRMLAFNADPNHGERQKAAWADPEKRARRTDGIKAAWADPEKRARHGERQKAAWADPEKRARESERQKAAWADPEKRARRTDGIKAAWADPEKRARHGERQKAAWADPEKRARRGVLSDADKQAIAREVSETDRPYVEIGLDWLVCAGRVASIAKELGVQRRPRNGGR